MPSVVVGWRGHCTDAGTREALIGRLLQLGRLSHGLFDEPPPLGRIGSPIQGRIVAERALFEAGARGRIELSELALDGLEFRLYDPRGLNQGEDRVSFVFAGLPGRPETSGTIVQVDGPDLCHAHHDPEIAAADYLVRPAGIRLHGYAEAWIGRLLGWIRHYYVADLDDWRHGRCPGQAELAGRDPADARERDRLWAEILAGFVAEVQKWMGAGGDLRGRLDHMNRIGALPLSFAFAAYSPIRARLILGEDLAARLPGKADQAELLQAARLAVLRARKGFDLYYLSFPFRGMVVAVSSRLEHDDLLVVRASLAATHQIRAIAEDEVPEPVRTPRPRRPHRPY